MPASSWQASGGAGSLAVLSDDGTHTGSGLGQQTMPETLHYSVVAAIQTLWLAARADGIGMGWVSILDPVAVTKALDVPKSWSLVAYLCLGLPAEHLDPELERHHWEQRTDLKDVVHTRWEQRTDSTRVLRLDAASQPLPVCPRWFPQGIKGNAVHVPAHNPAAAPATVSGELATCSATGRRKASGKAVGSEDPQARRPATSSGHARTHWAGCPDVETDPESVARPRRAWASYRFAVT